MARKKIRECSAKRLLARFYAQKNAQGRSLPVRCVSVHKDTVWKDLKAEYPWLSGTKLVVKPDMLFGQRGKNNLVGLNLDFDQAEAFVKERLGKELTINGVTGIMSHFIVEPFVPHDAEYYLSITANREGNLVAFSPAGGVEIEENWDKVVKKEIGVLQSIDESGVMALFDVLPAGAREAVAEFFRTVYRVFVDLDFTLIEFNPFTLDKDGSPFPLDMRGELDDTASFKNMKNWGDIEFPLPFGRELFPEEIAVNNLDEKTGASLKFTILNPNGRIWTMSAGGGASVIMADCVADLGYGAELANYGEYSGAPNEEETYHYARTVLDVATRNPDGRTRVMLICGGVSNFTDVAKTFKGIISAIEQYAEDIKASHMRIYVRRGGPNYRKGLRMMRELGERLGLFIDVSGPEENLTSAVPKAIAYLEENKGRAYSASSADAPKAS